MLLSYATEDLTFVSPTTGRTAPNMSINFGFNSEEDEEDYEGTVSPKKKSKQVRMNIQCNYKSQL